MSRGPDESESERNLCELGKMLVLYLADHEDRYPDSLEQYEKECDRQVHRLDFAWIHKHIQYLGNGRPCKSRRPDVPVAYDRTMLTAKRETYVLFNAAYVRHVSRDVCVALGLIDL